MSGIRMHAALCALAFSFSLASVATALPRYSALYGQDCTLCHVNPTGAGLRGAYATRYLIPTELSMKVYDDEQLETIRPDLSPVVDVGLDLRTLYYKGEGERGGAISMQGDVYLGVQLDPRFVAYLDMGRGGAREYFGLAYILPWHGYLKAGRFTPDYGWRWADHQMASRFYLLDETGNEFPSSLIDTGVEIGMRKGILRFSGSLTDGGNGDGNHESYAGRAVIRLSPGPFNLALGASYLRRDETAGRRSAAGGFGNVAVGQLVWVWEVDETRNPRRTGVLVSNELTYPVVQGFFLRATYTFQDPDRDLQTGTRSRYGLGFDALTTPFFGVLLMANRYDNRQGQDVDEPSYYQGELVLHFLY